MTAPLLAMISAPPTPWTIRNTMIDTSSQASAHSSEAQDEHREPRLVHPHPAVHVAEPPYLSGQAA